MFAFDSWLNRGRGKFDGSKPLTGFRAARFTVAAPVAVGVLVGALSAQQPARGALPTPLPAPAPFFAGSSLGSQYCDEGVNRILFESDFESALFSTGGWQDLGEATIEEEAGYQGGLGVKLRPRARITKAQSTVGASRILLTYKSRTRGMFANNRLWIEWFDGSSWHVVEKVRRLGYQETSVELPAAAGNNPDFKLRFRHVGSMPHGKGHVDDVRLTQLLGHIEASGSLSVADNELILSASGLPMRSVGVFLFGASQIQVPMANGLLCVGGSRRLMPPIQAGTTGTGSIVVDLSAEPAFSSITQLAPVTIHFQVWHREGGTAANFSDALSLDFVP